MTQTLTPDALYFPCPALQTPSWLVWHNRARTAGGMSYLIVHRENGLGQMHSSGAEVASSQELLDLPMTLNHLDASSGLQHGRQAVLDLSDPTHIGIVALSSQKRDLKFSSDHGHSIYALGESQLFGTPGILLTCTFTPPGPTPKQRNNNAASAFCPSHLPAILEALCGKREYAVPSFPGMGQDLKASEGLLEIGTLRTPITPTPSRMEKLLRLACDTWNAP